MMNEIDDFLSNELPKIIEPIINQEIKDRLWKLNETEYSNLEQSLIKEGCRENILTWNNTIVDGHNRYEICKRHHIPYITTEKHFENLNQVLKWVDTNQLSRRNLTDEQRTILYGRISKINKLPNDGSRGNQVQKQAEDKMSRAKIANELKVSDKTLQRAEKYVDAIEDLTKNVGKEITDKIVSGNMKVSQQDVLQIAKLKPKEQEKVFTKLQSGEKYKSGTSAVKEVIKEKHFEERKEEHKLPDDIKIYNDDCRTILETIPDSSIDLLLTDPPYGINFKGVWSPNKKFEDDTPEYVAQLLEDCCKLWQSKLKNNAHLYIFSGWSGYPLFHSIISKYFDISSLIIWKKNNTSLSDFDQKYASCYEMIIFAKQLNKTEDRMLKNRQSPDVIEFNRVNDPDHSCSKPVDLLEYLITNSTVKNETVLDCFAGSFNSGIAAKNLKRNYIGIEKDTKWFNVGKNKIS